MNKHLPALAAQARITTPLGDLTAAATEAGLAGLWFDGQAHHPGALDAPVRSTHPHIARARAALERYWRGEPVRFDDVPLDLHGTPFQRAVWQALRRIARGGTCSYSDIAAAVGAPAAARAAGAAIGRNPVSVIVPCHRVLGRDGALTGYAGGLERKQSLLQLEHATRR
jgi:methylated-DNA-[protein]-cysteine S-methyltransferase